MTTTDPLASFGTIQTHQRTQAPDRPEQVKNNEGGYVFKLDPIAQLRRFLTMGTAGGTFYVGETALTQESGLLVLALTRDASTHKQLVDTIVEISLAGRAPMQAPTLFALAIACQHGSTEDKQYARKQITKVVRTGTHLFTFVGYLQQFGGWSRGLRKAVGAWYTEKNADQLAYQLIKYRSREGFTHRDVLRLCHPAIKLDKDTLALIALLEEKEEDWSEELRAQVDEIERKRANIDWSIKYSQRDYSPIGNVSPIITGFEKCWLEGADIPAILSEYPNIPWEGLPDEYMNEPKVWDKMLDNGVPVGALLRQLPRLTRMGMVPQMGGRTDEIVGMLTNAEALEKARIHPFNVLLALRTYRQGHGESSHWTPTAKIIDGLDEMFYNSFRFVEPTGKRTMQAIDISSSMTSYAAGKRGRKGVTSLPMNCAEVAAAMAMVTVRTEPNQMTVGFAARSGRATRDPRDSVLVDLPISARQRLDDVQSSLRGLVFGGTDCALPMLAAERHGLEIDTFVVYTDNETGHGDIHPFQALKQYRRKSGIDAKLVVVSLTPTSFSIADPSDSGMLDISGFDAAMPNLISDFSMGRV